MTNEIEARQLRAEGVPITTLDGREHRLLFDIEAIAEIEDVFGSLGGMQDALEQIGQHPESAKFFKPLLHIMKAALRHDPSADNVRFDTAAVGDYYLAVMKAIDISFPKGARPPADNPNPTDTNGSHGPTSTTSPPSGSVELVPSSGV